MQITRRAIQILLFLGCAPVFAEVVVEGVSGDVARAIRAGLSLTDDCDQARWLVRYRFGTTESEVRTILQTYGFYQPHIKSELSFDDTCWRARYVVDAGSPITIKQADVEILGEGGELDEFSVLVRNSPVRVGARLDHEAYEGFKSSLEEVASRLGFLDARFVTRKVSVDPENNTALIDVTFDTGSRYRFGTLSFQGQELSDKVVNRYATFKPGDAYDADKLTDLYQSLASSTYFQDIFITTGAPVGLMIPVDVRLAVGKASSTRLGVGYSTDLGPSAFVGRNSRLLNKHGHQLNLDLTVSPVESKMGGYYRIPQANVAEGWYSLYGGFERQNTDTSDTRKTSVGIRHIRPGRWGWIETRFFEVLSYQFDVAGIKESNLSLAPGVSFSHTAADNTTARPRRAHRFNFEISGTSTAIGSTENYLRLTVGSKVIQALATNVRVIARAKVGAVINDNFAGLPPDVRFFAGGDNSVRGYDLEEIGVLSPDGEVIGGDRLIEGSAEFDFRFHPDWGIATFIDAGSVSLGAYSLSFERSAGIGLRWYSPIGPVRFDLAKPLDDGSRSVRVHIMLGPDV